MNSTATISIRDASFGYKKSGKVTPVIKNVTLDFFPGELIGLVGLNGTGKSTLLKSICGLLPLLNGDVFVEGQSIHEISLAELSKKIAVVLTEKIGGFNLTAYDVVMAGQMPYTNAFHQLNDENKKIIDDAIEACGITQHAHKLLHELSDGLFQKTIIAKALAQQTRAMLLDEPTAFLDYASKHDLFLLLKKLTETERKCIVVSSHDLDLLLKYCTQLVVISNGVVELVSVSEARQNKSFLEIGGGFI